MGKGTLVALALVLAVAGPAGAQGRKLPDGIKVTAKADKVGPDGKQVVTVTLEMDKKWYTYANPAGLEDLVDYAMKVTVKGHNQLRSVRVDYPVGELVKNEVVGDYRIYRGKVVIKAHLQRAEGDTGPVEVTAWFNPRTNSLCMPPVRVKLPVP
jgi:hypothetical protein